MKCPDTVKCRGGASQAQWRLLFNGGNIKTVGLLYGVSSLADAVGKVAERTLELVLFLFRKLGGFLVSVYSVKFVVEP